MEEISRGHRYMIDITGVDLLCLGELGGRVNYEKMRYF